ncbi:hypothetical protein [Vampirovibrio chlorellavorus]|uniref:hypothetical protein n=1 Tax=Vampirovibrio chlorellavorus TaxID=758823 RepID=UPI0026EC0FA8|nr:hypothetical protein [Vampirovibrio chlorellavorus]
MLPMSSSLGFPAINTLSGMQTPFVTSSPGNSMTDFMRGINSLTYSATHNADGSDILSWANGLVQQSALRKQQQALQQQQQPSLASLLGGASGMPENATQPDMSQLMQFLMTLLSGLGAK